MFAIAVDLTVRSLKQHHPTSESEAYREIGRALKAKGFERTQGSVHLTEGNDLANLFSAIRALEQLSWFPGCVRDIREFRVEEWSDFTPMVTDRAIERRTAGASARKRQGRQLGVRANTGPHGLEPGDVVGQIRRFDDAGPAYEVVELAGDDEVLIEGFYSGERVTWPVAEVTVDPVAEVVP